MANALAKVLCSYAVDCSYFAQRVKLNGFAIKASVVLSDLRNGAMAANWASTVCGHCLIAQLTEKLAQLSLYRDVRQSYPPSGKLKRNCRLERKQALSVFR